MYTLEEILYIVIDVWVVIILFITFPIWIVPFTIYKKLKKQKEIF